MPGILIDVMRLVIRRAEGTIPTGIDRVGLAYLRHYGDRARAVLSLGPLAAALSARDSARLFEGLLEPRDSFMRLAMEMSAKCWLWNWLAPGTGASVLLNTSHQWIDSGQYAWQLRQLGARPVFFIHDLIPIAWPEYSIPGEADKHRRRVRNALALSRGIIVNSADTEAALRRRAGDLGVPCPPTVVAPLAPSVKPPLYPRVRSAESSYFVVLGTIEPRKNHLLLLHLWRRLVAQRGAERTPRLFVVGQRGWECENVVDMLERCEQLKGKVVERGDCSDAELADLLHHAQALLMPSFAEGYGLPVVEALAAGVPVIASDLPVFREIAGAIPEYADPLDGARWAELIDDYASDGPRRWAQLQRIGTFRPPTWREHFAAVDRFLEALP